MTIGSANPWNGIFAREGRVFKDPHERMPEIVRLLKDREASAVLDLGCGSGRHVVYLAMNGFSVFGLDSSPEAIEMARQWLADEGLSAELQLGDMRGRLTYSDGFFDAVIAIQVIHHARIATIRDIVGEIARVLKEEGFVFATVPKAKHTGERRQEIEPGTFIPLDGPEKGLPHHYFTPQELRAVFKGFRVADVRLDATNHYCLWGFRRETVAACSPDA